MDPDPQGTVRTGRVAIVGRPNVGKSTLLNALVGEPLSITSRKAQTTRDAILGIRTDPAGQMIFVDTPGFQQRHRSLLARRMNQRVRGALSEVDAAILVIDARGWTDDDQRLLDLLPRADADGGAGFPPVVLALNKSDELRARELLLPVLADCARRYPFAAFVPVSALKGRQLDDLLSEVRRLLPEGLPLFDAEQYTDRSVRFLAGERIREKAFRLLGDEIPFGIAVAIDRWIEDDARCEIAASLVVLRESHRGIVIGAQGSRLGAIGASARHDLIGLLGKPVRLDLHVRVRRNWNEDPRSLDRLGYG